METQKRFVQGMEKVLWLIERIKSGLRLHAGDFSLDNAPRWGRTGEVDSDRMETLRMINIIPCGREPTHSK